MKIDQGLFKLDFQDHHAILGIAIDAEPKEVRKRYLKIARKLHPDSFAAASESEKQQASDMLSKLVNPAYEILSQDKSASEHALVLRLRGKQLSQQQASLELVSDAARSLLTTNNVDYAYANALNALAADQYESLDAALEITGQISELNLVYLIRKAGDATPAAPAAAPAKPTAGPAAPNAPKTPPPPPSPRRTRETIVESYLNRAKEFERDKDYSRAILELREALKTYPQNALCHSQLAAVYLKAGQPTMARIHAKRALEIDDSDEQAQTVQKSLERSNADQAKGRAKSGDSSSNKPSRGGFLGGLFGGKK